MHMLRICVPAHDAVLHVNQDGSSFTGAISKIIVHVLDTFRGPFNRSVVKETSFGKLIDDQTMAYDGCLGSMQRNASDVMVCFQTMPFKGANLTPATVYGSQQMSILSGYKTVTREEDSVPTHVLDMFLAMSAETWFLLIVLLTALLMLMSARLRMTGRGRKESRRVAVKALVACLLKQLSSASLPQETSVSMIFTIMLQLTFYSGFFLTSMIKTEVVVVHPPVTVKSYQELVDLGRRPLWLEPMPDRLVFQESSSGSMEQAIWRKANDMGLNESLITADMSSALTKLLDAANCKSVLLTMKATADTVARVVCMVSRFAQSYETMKPPIATDPEFATDRLVVNVHNHLLHNTIARHIHRQRQRVFQADLIMSSFRFFDYRLLVWDTLSLKSSKASAAVDDCCNNVVDVPHFDMETVPVVHYVTLAGLVVLGYAFAISILLMERQRDKQVQDHEKYTRTVIRSMISQSKCLSANTSRRGRSIGVRQSTPARIVSG